MATGSWGGWGSCGISGGGGCSSPPGGGWSAPPSSGYSRRRRSSAELAWLRAAATACVALMLTWANRQVNTRCVALWRHVDLGEQARQGV